MTRSEKIAQILSRRAEHARSIEALDAHLATVGAGLTRLDESRLELQARLVDEARDRLYEVGREIQDLHESLRSERAEIRRLTGRLNRPTVNVGMVGRARMGKSRFLQSLTGLSSEVIPDGSGGFCTGVPSLITHVPGAQSTAEVFLHDESSFLAQVVAPYFTKLELGDPPVSASEFGRQPLPPAPSDAPAVTSMYAHLAAFHDNYPAYEKLLRTASPLRIDRQEEIRSYVAQDNKDGSRQYHAFRAVRRVVVRTGFRIPDVEGLGVIDLPGLGDTNLGDEQALLRALRDDVDVVLFVRKPAAHGDDIQNFDIELYTLALEALPEIPMSRRSFMIINHHRSTDETQDNLENARRYQAKVAVSAIQVVSAQIVDCAGTEEVLAAFDPVIEHLLAHADEFDRQLTAGCLARAAEIHGRLLRLSDRAGRIAALAELNSRSGYRVFQELFNRSYVQLTGAVESIRKRLEADRNKADGTFATAVEEVVRKAKADTGIPSEDEIEDRINKEYGTRSIAYGKLLTEARTHLSRHFLELDVALAKRVAEMKHEVAEALARDGGLRPLSPRTGRGFLEDLAKCAAPEDESPDGMPPEEDNELRYGLSMLADFELSYRGFIQHRIRPQLEGMHADRATYTLPKHAELVPVRTLRQALEVTYKESLEKCNQVLGEILNEPNGALFALVEEFQDRLLRSAGNEDEWRALYLHFSEVVWTQEFGSLAERSGLFVNWNKDLDSFRACLGSPLWQEPADGIEGAS
jgi:ribosomal 50S subunit-associated protein YjgA (DUF615 family)